MYVLNSKLLIKTDQKKVFSNVVEKKMFLFKIHLGNFQEV